MASFCPRCSSTVENKDGYCLLGHPLRTASGVAGESPLADLRREVNDAFEDGSPGLERALTPAVAAEISEPQPGRPSRYLSPDDPISAFAPAPRMDWGPAHTPLRRLLQRAPRSED
jgi:hypothetical protein